MRYRIPLDGNPSTDVALRDKYIAAFGTACYMSEANTYDCFYEEWQDARADAVEIAEVYGAAPLDRGYSCQPVGNGDYTLQVGPDVANKITIYYQAAPRQTPLVEVDGVPTEVNGPYRNLTEPKTLRPGEDFECDSGMVDANGDGLQQRKWILQVNRKANGGKVHSDLAGFTWLCKRKNEKCEEVVEACKEERSGHLCEAQQLFDEQRPAGGRGEDAQQREGIHAVTRSNGLALSACFRRWPSPCRARPSSPSRRGQQVATPSYRGRDPRNPPRPAPTTSLPSVPVPRTTP